MGTKAQQLYSHPPPNHTYVSNGSACNNPNLSLLDPHKAEDYLDLNKECDRLESFRNNWDKPFIDVELLARTGFYFKKQPDYTKCHFCKITIWKWEEKDDIMQIHQTQSACCPLIRRRTTANIPIDSTKLDNILPPVSYDICGTGSHFNLEPKMYVHENWMREDERLRSFETWPRALKQTSEEMAEAGFFYSGKGDRVICFSCGIGLKDWEDTDIPWVEHAKACDSCHYMEVMKGTSFISNVRNNKLKNLAVFEQKVEETKANVIADSEVADIPLEKACKVCYDKVAEIVLIPCGHCATCPKCSVTLTKCPICRNVIRDRMKVFFS